MEGGGAKFVTILRAVLNPSFVKVIIAIFKL
jgi:hypothetical protein